MDNVEFKIKILDTCQVKDIHSIAIFDKERKTVFGVIQDITDRKRAEEALLESEHKFRSLIEDSPDDALIIRELLAEGYLLADERAKAFSILQELLRQHPGDPELLLLLDAETPAQLRAARGGRGPLAAGRRRGLAGRWRAGGGRERPEARPAQGQERAPGVAGAAPGLPQGPGRQSAEGGRLRRFPAAPAAVLPGHAPGGGLPHGSAGTLSSRLLILAGRG